MRIREQACSSNICLLYDYCKPMEASEQARTDAEQDATDDFLMHRDDDTAPTTSGIHTEDDGDVGDDNSAALAPLSQPDNELECWRAR